MGIDKLSVLVVSFFGMVATYWFFLMKKETAVSVSDAVEITVDGGYTPSAITLQQGQEAKITFFRKDQSSCLEEVVLSDFGIRKFLPLHKRVTISITPKEKGEFVFSCGMNMFHGKIIVT
jgi:plastocyanin domain-containing protein